MDIYNLLHDARLLSLRWQPDDASVSLSFSSLRRTSDGSSLEDTPVEFLLQGVRAIIVGYEPENANIRPTEYNVQRLIEVEDLLHWPFQPVKAFLDAYMGLYPEPFEEDVLDMYRANWVTGDQPSLGACPLRLTVSFYYSPALEVPHSNVVILLGVESAGFWSGGQSLDLTMWEARNDAWFAAEEDESGLFGEVGSIPQNDPASYNFEYRPPNEPVVQWERTDAPEELLALITRWFEEEGAIAPNPLDKYRWAYARQVDEWWVEGNHALVKVRGVEHTMPDEEGPGKNRESAWAFKLRKRPDGWRIRNHSQGWPRYGSAAARPRREKPWLERWKSGTIEPSVDDVDES